MEFKTHYYNAFESKDGYYIESKALTADEVIEDINLTPFSYAYTLKVSLKKVERVDFEMEALNARYPEDEYERLTGHELGIKAGRV